MKNNFVSRLKAALFGDAALRVELPVVATPACMSFPLHVKTRSLCMLLLVITTLSMTTHPAHAQGTGTKTGSWSVNFADKDNWYSFGWSSKPEIGANGTRSWSGTDTTFTGQGGWFSSSWTGAGGSWIPDISRSGPGFHALSKMVTNYNVQWTGTGSIVPNGSSYTFGLKFNLTAADSYKEYDMTSSYECYIVTQTNKPADKREGKFMGTVYPPGDPVGYDCYVFDAYWGGKNNGSDGKFKQLWAWRKQNTWSGPVNVQAILKFWSDKSGTSFNIKTWYLPTGLSIAPETFDTSGSFRLSNIKIPDLDTLLPLPKATPKATPTAKAMPTPKATPSIAAPTYKQIPLDGGGWFSGITTHSSGRIYGYRRCVWRFSLGRFRTTPGLT